MFTLRRGEGRSPHYVYPRGGTHSAYHRITTRLQLTGNHNGLPKTVQKTEHHSALWTESGISHGKNNRSPLPATPNSLPRLTPRPTRLNARVDDQQPPAHTISSSSTPPSLPPPAPAGGVSSLACSPAHLRSRATTPAGQLPRPKADSNPAPSYNLDKLRLRICHGCRQFLVVIVACDQYPINTGPVHLRPLQHSVHNRL